MWMVAGQTGKTMTRMIDKVILFLTMHPYMIVIAIIIVSAAAGIAAVAALDYVNDKRDK